MKEQESVIKEKEGVGPSQQTIPKIYVINEILLK
jgi:hypothetical protein